MNDFVLLNKCDEKGESACAGAWWAAGVSTWRWGVRTSDDTEASEHCIVCFPFSLDSKSELPSLVSSIDTAQDFFCSAGSGLSSESGRVEVYVAELNLFSHYSWYFFSNSTKSISVAWNIFMGPNYCVPSRILGKTSPHSSYWMRVYDVLGLLWNFYKKRNHLELRMHTIVARLQNVRGTNSGARRNH